jgi:DNA-binding PadR family transcriptional regulator
MKKWPSQLEAEILQCVLNDGPIYGLAIAKKGISKRGSVYVMLSRLEAKGLVQSAADEVPDGYVGIARRYYWATPLGRRLHEALKVLLGD